MWRIWTVFGCIIFCFVLITIRLFYWQVIRASSLRLEAAAQYALRLDLPAQRGTIKTSDGSTLVLNKQAFLIYAMPHEIEDMSKFEASVAPVLGLDIASVSAQIRVEGRVWAPLAHKADESVVEALSKFSLKGLGFEKEPKRYYVESSMAAHLIGFVGSDQHGLDTGYFGVEGHYDRELQGKSGYLEVERDARGEPILVGDVRRFDAEDGRTLTLFLDRTVQYIVEEELKNAIDRFGATAGAAIMMDPKTGGIIAMGSYPNYDPSEFNKFSSSLYKNPVVAEAFEPGSTFKTLVMAAALEEDAIKPAETMNEDGPVEIGQYKIRTWNNEYSGKVSMTGILERSSNVGMVYIQRKLGEQKLVDYIKSFGFGELTNIDLQEEVPSEIRDEDTWHEIDYATASFGQGIAVTPIQMLRAVTALANDGWLMEPHVVKEITSQDGETVSIKPKRVRQVVSEKTASIVTEMMVSAVENGDSRWVRPKGYRVAGKTGTAQIPVAGHYDSEKTIASFVGFAPADDPKFVMLVTLKEPTSSPWGSETAAPLFFSITNRVLSYYGSMKQ